MTNRLPLRDYSRSRAVVMGTGQYTFLDQVPAAKNSLYRMAGLLTGPLCGWPQDRLLMVEDESGPGELPDRLITAFDGITDVALFYYVGHGQIAPDDQLCLGLVQTRPEANRRAATSLRFSDVRQALLDSGAAVKIVILDCCFAGLATAGTLAGLAGDVLDLTTGTGAYTMAATSAYATAWYEQDRRLARPQTYFTKYLADLVEEGVAGQPSWLRLDVLFRQLRQNLAADQRPVPQSRAVNDAREFAFAYNAAPPRAQRDPERELAQLARRLAESDAQVRVLKNEAAQLARLVGQTSRTIPNVDRQRDFMDSADQAASHGLSSPASPDGFQGARGTSLPDRRHETSGHGQRDSPRVARRAPRRPGRRAFVLMGIGALVVVVGIGAAVEGPRLFNPPDTDPGCIAYNAMLPAYDRTVTELNDQASQATLTQDFTNTVSSLTNAVGLAQSTTKKTALQRLLTDLTEVQTDIKHGSVPSAAVEQLNAAASAADGACPT
jgi:hypothetical protein